MATTRARAEWANSITRAVVDEDPSDPLRRSVVDVARQLGTVVVFMAAVGDDEGESGG